MYNNIRNIYINNANNTLLNEDIDLFISCIGYEERSYYLYNRIRKRISMDKMLLFCVTNSTINNSEAVQVFKDARDTLESVCFDVEYGDSSLVQSTIIDRVKSVIENKKDARIHIDYSSMPRSWYCKLPELFCSIMSLQCQIYFWYTEGTYENEHHTAGIESYVLYSGIPSIAHIHRTHFIGIGFDSDRTEGIITLINPESFVSCFANNPHRQDITDKVKMINEYIMARSNQPLPLDITDMETMIAELSGRVYEKHSAQNDVVLVPDGPKPLIFTMSIIPWLIGKPGICCLHFKRNNRCFKPENVKPLDNYNSEFFEGKEHIIGFSIQKQQTINDISSKYE